LKRSKINTRKRRNRAYLKPQISNETRDNLDFTVEHTLENQIKSLPNVAGEDIFNKAAQDYLDSLNTPINEPTKEMPTFLNHGTARENHFHVFEERHAAKIAYWQAVLVVTIGVCMILGALIISWRLHLPEWCYRQ
jgi:hypothetical protein